MRVQELFLIDVAKSKSIDDYTQGTVPFVTNTEVNNGVVAYVEPFDDDRVFDGPAICVSGLGHATVHFSVFLPKGNGGDSCTILTPKNKLNKSEILYYAALFNALHCWRFSFGRKASKRRLENLDMSPLHTSAPISLAGEIGVTNKLMEKLLRDKDSQLTSS